MSAQKEETANIKKEDDLVVPREEEFEKYTVATLANVKLHVRKFAESADCFYHVTNQTGDGPVDQKKPGVTLYNHHTEPATAVYDAFVLARNAIENLRQSWNTRRFNNTMDPRKIYPVVCVEEARLPEIGATDEDGEPIKPALYLPVVFMNEFEWHEWIHGRVTLDQVRKSQQWA